MNCIVAKRIEDSVISLFVIAMRKCVFDGRMERRKEGRKMARN